MDLITTADVLLPRLLARRAILFVMHQTIRPKHDPATTPADR
jgi:hypothetical protein